MKGEPAQSVIVTGHCCVDLLPSFAAEPIVAPGAFSNVGPLEVRCGGSVVNTGEALVALGWPIHVVATIGDDHLGGVLGARLRELDHHAQIETVQLGTSYSIVLERRGESRTIWHHEGSNAGYAPGTVDPNGASLVHLGYATTLPGLLDHDLAPFLDLLGRIAAAGATSSVDFATVDPRTPDFDAWPQRLERLLPLIDVVSPSADDLVSMGWLTPAAEPEQIADAAGRLVEAGAGVAFVTDGARGAYLHVGAGDRLARGGRVLAALGSEWHGAQLWTPAVPVETVLGTNGAGDTATAGLIHALLSGYTPRNASRTAAALAAARIAGRDLRRVAIS